MLYSDKQFSGEVHVLSEGHYPDLASMGCAPGFKPLSIKVVPMVREAAAPPCDYEHCLLRPLTPPFFFFQSFSVPSISLFGLECLEGREITTESEIMSMVEEGFNDHILSVRVNRGW